MNIPKRLIKLYKHWDKHTNYSHNVSNAPIEVVESELIKRIKRFAKERMLIWQRKEANSPKPYTDNPILAKYRFCNIYRELDRQTIEIHEELKNVEEDFELWLLNLSFYRFVCRTETVKSVGLLNFNEEHNKRIYEKLMAMDSPKYGSAYIFPISVIQKSDFNTREMFFAKYLPKAIRKVSARVLELKNCTVVDALKVILPEFGFNLKFHWTEILIDVAYQYPDLINLHKNFYIGPGAAPVLKRLGKDKQESLNSLVQLKFEDFPYLTFNGKPIYFSAENWECIACEYRKYKNLKEGKGRIRLYK